MTFALIVVALLVLVGTVARMKIPVFRWMYIPASVIAGLLGLLLVQLAATSTVAPPVVGQMAADLSQQWSRWPGWLIAVVFATLLLENRPGNSGSGVRRTASQVVMVWIIVLGQTAVGLTLTWIAVQPFFELPNSFGMLIETGFAGGHGTAAAMGLVFSHPNIALDAGLDLGVLMATAGLVYGVVSGIFWINVAVRLGWIQRSSTPRPSAAEVEVNQTPLNASDMNTQKSPIGFAVMDRELIDPLLVQIVWVTLAVGVGLLLQWLVSEFASLADQWRYGSDPALLTEAGTALGAEAELAERMRISSVLGSFPLFIYTLVGGWLVRRTLQFFSAKPLIDNATIKRLSAVAMDILVVAAIGSLSLQAVASLLVPFLILLGGAAVWTAICLMFLSPIILPKQHWFELGLINYGMSTGTTATGFVLLRVVDPELKTQAAEDYALAAPFSAPFIGGGMITVALPLLVLESVPIWASATLSALLVLLLIWLGYWMRTGTQLQQ